MHIYIIFTFILFLIGFVGAILIKRYFILTLISIELMLLAININLLFFLFF